MKPFAHSHRFQAVLWIAALALSGALPSEAKDTPGRFRVRDAGRTRTFEIADNEWHVRRSDGLTRIEQFRDAVGRDRRRAIQPQAGVREELAPVAYELGKPRSSETRRVVTRRLLMQLAPGVEPGSVAATVPGGRLKGPTPWAADWFQLEVPQATDALQIAGELRSRPGVLKVRAQLGRQRDRDRIPNDPYFPLQWHLHATETNSGSGLLDIAVTNVWDRFRGEGMVIAVLDDSVEMLHPDLTASIDLDLAYDFRDGDDDPNPVDLAEDIHGTGVAGLAVARGDNGLGLAGVAYAATLAPLRLIGSDDLTDETIAEAMLFRNDIIQVKNNSWGSRTTDDVNAPASELELALEKGVSDGRQGRGEIYVFSSGNQGNLGDDINYNMLKNRPDIIPVGSINEWGEPTSYTTGGAPLVVVAPGGDAGAFSIRTTDLTGANGLNTGGIVGEVPDLDYTANFSGTSASAPIVSGVIALMLEANPQLGWRDVQEILMRSARKVMPGDLGWATNSAGRHFHPLMGAGLVQATPAVALALTWTNLPPARKQAVVQRDLALRIPDNTGQGVVRQFLFEGPPMRVEHVRAVVDISHPSRGQLQLTLTSPSGMMSRLASRHADHNDDWEYWTFTSRRHWGEESSGIWTLEVKDVATRSAGTWNYARVELLGTLVGGLELATDAWIEAEGQGLRDGVLSPGEIIEERIVLRNVTNRALEGVSAELSTDDGGLTLLQSTSSYPTIPPGGTATNLAPFTYRVDSSNSLCGAWVHLRHVALADGLRTTNVVARRVGIALADAAFREFEASEGLPLTVVDRGTVFATNRIDGPERIIQDLEVSVRVDHTAIGDTQFSLIHPDGTEVMLSENRGGNNPNLGVGDCVTGTRTVFADDAVEPISAGKVPFAGRYRPDSPLAVLRGKPLNGVWRLRASDVYDEDSGTLFCWSMRTTTREVTTQCAPYVPLRITGFGFEPDGSFRVRGEGSALIAVTLEATVDFASWSIVTSQPPQGTTFELADVEATDHDHRYYRVRIQ